jgi:hypothetical protein
MEVISSWVDGGGGRGREEKRTPRSFGSMRKGGGIADVRVTRAVMRVVRMDFILGSCTFTVDSGVMGGVFRVVRAYRKGKIDWNSDCTVYTGEIENRYCYVGWCWC